MKEPTSSEFIEIKKSYIHNNGIFAIKNIAKGTKILEYVGEKILKKESDKRAEKTFTDSYKNKTKGSVYIFELDNEHDIDGSVDYNTARYINHSCNPNSETEGDDKHIWIQATKNIKKGEEICYDYGYDIDDFKEHPCKCNSPKCVGYIISEKLQKKLLKKIKKQFLKN